MNKKYGIKHILICITCNNEFIATTGEINRGRKYCSRSCVHKGKSFSQTHRERLSLSHLGQKSAWKGDNIGYRAIHDWVQRELGKAKKCSNSINHKSTRFHWANISQEYKRDLSDWRELCPSCNAKERWDKERKSYV